MRALFAFAFLGGGASDVSRQQRQNPIDDSALQSAGTGVLLCEIAHYVQADLSRSDMAYDLAHGAVGAVSELRDGVLPL